MSSLAIAWDEIIHDARGYLDLEDDAPVPRDELLEQAKAHGYSEHDARQSLRETALLTLADENDLDSGLTEAETPPTTTGDDEGEHTGESIPAEDITEHYRRAARVYEALGSLAGFPTLGVADLWGWYLERANADVETLRDGFDHIGRPTALWDDYDALVEKVDRSMYATTSYVTADATRREGAFRWKDDGDGREWAGGENPLPEYADIRAYPVWGDIDLVDEVKATRGDGELDEATRETVENALAAYAEEFAELYGTMDAVTMLDSVGGAYIFGAPEATLPIAELFDDDPDARERVFNAFYDRQIEWADGATERVNACVEGAGDVLDPDWVGHKSRQYKAPLSVHKRIDAVVTPVDPADPEYHLTPFTDVDEACVDEAEAWAREHTAGGNEACVEQLVATLWPTYSAEHDGWQAALEAWVDDEREKEHEERERRKRLAAQRENGPATTTKGDVTITPNFADLDAALDALNAQDVAGKTIVHSWNDNAGTSDGVRAFRPIWGPDCNGTANIVNEDVWTDTDGKDQGAPVEMALIRDGGWTRGTWASGADWWRGVDLLRDTYGYDIPLWIPGVGSENADGEEYEQTPLWALRNAAVALGVCEDEDFVERESDDGGTYLGFPDSETYNETLAALEDAGIDHGRDAVSTGNPVSALPLGQLDALDHADRKRAARKRGVEWPSTRKARERLFETLTDVMGHHDTAVVDAPTSIGKSYAVATTPWGSDQYADVTGDRLVVHLSATRDARDENIEAARDADISYFVLRARDEACSVAAGDHDPAPDDECPDDHVELTVDGTPASEWLRAHCDGKGVPFSAAHRRLESANDQGIDTLPCCPSDDGTCPSIAQWESLRSIRDSDDEQLDVVFGTHEFAHVPGLRMHTNLVIDEEPDYTESISKERLTRAITAYLQEINAPVNSWEGFIQLARSDVYGSGMDIARERDALQHKLGADPEREWYFEHPDAHTLAPPVARALFRGEERAAGRWFGKTVHEPPRLDAGVRSDDGWNREWVSVTMTDDNHVESIRSAPDFSQARSVVGLDAHPARPKWMVNVHPAIQTTAVLDAEERRLWRRYERGLRVVQVGDATRPLSGDKALTWLDDEKLRAFFDHLVDTYGADTARTAITTAQVERRVGELMKEAGCYEPTTMHYGEEKSRNDFKNERIGAVLGCMDPGDDHVLNILAELGLDAEPETHTCTQCDGAGCSDDWKCHDGRRRTHGRGFVGDDAETAYEVLASVRESHVAQAAGRYARNPDDPESHATVFVRTNALPAGFADVVTPGVEWAYTDLQAEIITTLRDAHRPLAAQTIADTVECSREHVRKTLRRHVEKGTVRSFDGSGANGATLYAEHGCPNHGYVDVGDTSNTHVWDSNTWLLEIAPPTPRGDDVKTPAPPPETSHAAPATPWDWDDGPGSG